MYSSDRKTIKSDELKVGLPVIISGPPCSFGAQKLLRAWHTVAGLPGSPLSGVKTKQDAFDRVDQWGISVSWERVAELADNGNDSSNDDENGQKKFDPVDSLVAGWVKAEALLVPVRSSAFCIHCPYLKGYVYAAADIE